ncbi:MAG: exonuclease domain-containing protein [Velocimicrobium sp.]
MNFIVMDLEWNQGMDDDIIKKKIPFEIIEIGAVKLGNDRKQCDSFQRIIKPNIYLELFPVTQSIVQIEQKELEEGISFIDAIHDFFDWCGNDFSFCTWGNMDLVELQRNMRFYGINDRLQKTFYYYDVQKLFALEIEGRKNPRTLEYAVEFLDLKKEMDFHRALCDAKYTAEIFERLDETLIKTYFSIDYFNNPKTAEDEIYVNYGTYSKFISREFESKEAIFNDGAIKELACFICGKAVVKKIDWFCNNPKNYYCLGYCSHHGYLKGRIQINKVENGNRFVVKIVSKINKEGAMKLKIRHDAIRIKRMENH